ncbi:MAG: glycosyl hydrolase [Candidatus Methylacidiphilales bacterium]|nr:glycosyl hydrolase [Candidatus Methylacidiphilales bacterium]
MQRCLIKGSWTPRRLPRMLAVFVLGVAAPVPLSAAIIQAGNVTSTLGPTFFIDNALNGGTDTDINQPAVGVFDRYFKGLLTPNQGPTRVSITGFGFAAHTSATANDATSVAVTFTYLGANEASGGGDDVVLGTVTGNYSFTGGGEYVFAFDSALTANLTITGTRFRIAVAPSNSGGNGSLKIKNSAISYETGTGASLSVAGVAASQIIPQRVNLAKYQPVTVSSVSGNRLGSYVTDGDAGNDSRWISQNWAYNTARIDFPFPVEVGSAQLFMGVDDTLPLAKFGLQYLNGSTWTTINGTDIDGNSNVERNLVFGAPVTASSFRIIVTDPTIRLREFALYPPNGPSGYPIGTDIKMNLALQRPAVASSHTTGQFPIYAVDGRTHTGSSWQTTTNGTNTLDIEMVASTKIGSVHLYSGSATTSALADFTLKYWNGTAWTNIPGGGVTGNTQLNRIIPFTTPVTTTKLRLEFTKSSVTPTIIRELQIFPANTGNVGYVLGTDINPSGAYADYEDFNDAYHQITNIAANLDMAVATTGQPALESVGISAAQAQYQVLLNLADGTYRLRNRDTGECLSGAQLSQTAGLALTDEPYLALPHQDWILEPLGGGRYRLINAWSGLAIDTQGGATAPGTALVQNTAGNATSQQWRINYDTWASKKGIGGAFVGMKSDWLYNWGPSNSVALPADTVYHPMQWGSFNWTYNTGSGPIWQRTSEWRRRGDGMLLLGFNEPDRTDQSNIPLTDCVTLWPQLMALNQPLVSPSPGTLNPPVGVPSWHETFYAEAERLGYRVEYNAIHTYPGPSSGSSDYLINLIEAEYNDFGRPIWLTEFGFVDWGGNQSWSEEDNYQCLAEFLWRAEGLGALRKYALFVFTADENNPEPANPWGSFTPAPRSNSYDTSGNLTPFGKLYAAWDCDTTVRTDKTYIIHHRGLRKRLANAATGNTNPGGRTIRTDGAIVNWTLVSAGVSNRYYVVSSIDGRRLSHTTGTGVAPTLAAAGTTGVNVEWSLTHKENGWFYLGHPNSNTRLKLVSFNTSNNVTAYQMVTTTTTDDSVQWRFIVPIPDNTPPSLSAIPDQVTNELTNLTFSVNATDSTLPAGNLTYSIVDPLSNTTINSTTGVFSWTPSEGQGNGTAYTFTIRASDGQLAADRTVNITVNEVNVAPALSPIPSQTMDEGTLVSFTANGTDADLPANTLTYSLINAPSGASINSSSGNFSWMPSEALGPGTFNFTVMVSDGNLTANRSVSLTVNEVNTAPVLAAIPSLSVNMGSLLSFTANGTDADLPANTLTYSLSGAPGGAAINPGSGVFTWTPSGAQGPGTFNFSVLVNDGFLTANQPVSVNVASAYPSPGVDSDGDGLSDLMELAFMTNPAIPNGSPFRVVSANSGNTVTLTYPWNWQASGLSWQIRHGRDLSNIPSWPVVAPASTNVVREGNVDRVTVTVPMAYTDRGFYVIEVIVN